MALTLNNFTGFDTGGDEEALAVAGWNYQPGGATDGGTYYLQGTTNSSYDIAVDLSAGTYYIVGFYYKTGDFSLGGFNALLQARHDGPGIIWSLAHPAGDDTNLRLTFADTSTADFAHGMSLDTWHFIEIIWDYNEAASNAIIEVHIDGAQKYSASGKDMLDSGGDFYRYRLLNTSSTDPKCYDNFYMMSGASSVGDFLGDCEIFNYQTAGTGWNSTGDALDVGTWDLAGETPADLTDPGNIIGYEGGAQEGDSDTDGSVRSGPNGDGDIDGTIEACKYLAVLKRGSGSGTTHYQSTGNSSDGIITTVQDVSTAFQAFSVLRDKADASCPLSNEYARHGIKKTTGGRELYAGELWSMVLHVPPTGPVINTINHRPETAMLELMPPIAVGY